jgi:hypothetical protein
MPLTARLFLVLTLGLAMAGEAPAEPSQVLVTVAAPGSEARFAPSDQANGQVIVARSTDPAGVELTIAPGTSSYPGVVVGPEGGVPWNLAAFGHVEARLTNLGAEKISVVIRLDDDADGGQTSNAQNFALKPGETRVCKALFGYSWGAPSASINPGKVTAITIFSGKVAKVPAHFRIESLQAAGPAGEKMPVDPNLVATRPAGGVIVGPGIVLDPKQLVAKAGAKAVLVEGGGIDLTLTAAKQTVTVKPPVGCWRLNDHLEVKVRLRNTGTGPAFPRVRLESRPGPSDEITATSPLAPGTETELTIPFKAAVPWRGVADPAQNQLEGKKEWGGEPGTGTLFASCFANGITISADAPAELRVLAAVAGMPKVELPAWLGQRPPVDGDWVQTFNDDFDGTSIDLNRWNIYTETEWHLGAQTHYSKDNVIVKDGMLTLRVERKHGHHNDNPAMKANDLATGNADTFGKWTQRYGYFEARMKLPTAPSMFTAFWMMPDRGIDTPDEGWGRYNARRSTKNGGMEFDIMESLSLWGPWRHDFGMHWDDYVKYHKSTGVFTCYVPPDKDGFITVGMLWTPGLVVMYDNGREAARWESPRVGWIQSYFILQNITGGWESEPLDDRQLPGDMVFDYVRAWQRKDLATPADGPKPNLGGPYAPPYPSPAASAPAAR